MKEKYKTITHNALITHVYTLVTCALIEMNGTRLKKQSNGKDEMKQKKAHTHTYRKRERQGGRQRHTYTQKMKMKFFGSNHFRAIAISKQRECTPCAAVFLFFSFLFFLEIAIKSKMKLCTYREETYYTRMKWIRLKWDLFVRDFASGSKTWYDSCLELCHGVCDLLSHWYDFPLSELASDCLLLFNGVVVVFPFWRQ